MSARQEFTRGDYERLKKEARRAYAELRRIGFDEYITLEDVEGELGVLYAGLLRKYPDNPMEEMTGIFVRAAQNWAKNYKRDKQREMSLEERTYGPDPKFNPNIVEFRKLYCEVKGREWAYSLRDLARHYGVDEASIRRFIKRMGLVQRVEPEKHPGEPDRKTLLKIYEQRKKKAA